jgi:DNA anti-recombination protein RmuC
MSCVTHSAFIPAPVKRLIALAGFTAALLLAAPPLPALAGTQAAAQQTRAAKRAETVEQRIAALHTALKITPAQETGWQAVAQTMRDNAAALEKLAEEEAGQSRKGMTALEDMQSYEQAAQAHVDGLKRLIASFAPLYDAMPDEQKKLVDQVFQRVRRGSGVAGG